jgi:hypothetical protein
MSVEICLSVKDRTVRTIVREELSKMPTTQADQPKKEKKKSVWNIFLADCTKKQPKGTPLGDRAKACSVEYKELKKNGSLENFISNLQAPVDKGDNNKRDNNKDGDSEQK